MSDARASPQHTRQLLIASASPARARVATLPNRPAHTQNPDYQTTKQQVIKMLRVLITITAVLAPVPAERCILMKVEYTPDAPAAFGTPNFRDATPAEAAAQFATTPVILCAAPRCLRCVALCKRSAVRGIRQISHCRQPCAACTPHCCELHDSALLPPLRFRNAVAEQLRC